MPDTVKGQVIDDQPWFEFVFARFSDETSVLANSVLSNANPQRANTAGRL
jgi:hypothetical protein